MHERLYKGLKACMIGNLLFLLFSVVCLIYYATFEDGSAVSKILELIAYGCEFGGFALLIWGDWLIASSIRFRNLMKLCFTLYIVLESVMMILELNSYKFSFYKPYSLALAIAHAAVSGFVCLTFLQLETDKKPLERSVIICAAIIFAGMLGNILGLRIYFSIMVNGIAYALMFFLIMRLIKREEIEVDCHGDRARVAEYKSTFFDE
ncbi:hypothetical protein [uncultured Ruminococcus sp.]|uniref:hypothetical protein n=1 Tax=uncultured Ruminococcus sp. TaxID=165186 RepID=UPI0026377FB1|nr:hypothetical protein [uncultured Ruminococcus sp.]